VSCRDLSQRAEAEKARARSRSQITRMLVEQVTPSPIIAEVGIDDSGFTSALKWRPFSATRPKSGWASPSAGQLIHADDLPTVAAAEEASKSGTPFQRNSGSSARTRRSGSTTPPWSCRAAIPTRSWKASSLTSRNASSWKRNSSNPVKWRRSGRLAGGIAHDFNNLLTIITGYTELALSRPTVPPELRSDIERIETAAGRAAGSCVSCSPSAGARCCNQKPSTSMASFSIWISCLRRLMDDNVEMVTHVPENVAK